jgi:hypothetical protein
MAVLVHLIKSSKPIAVVLDVVKLPKSHSGVNLANAMAGVIKDFGIQDKVSSSVQRYIRDLLS